MMNVRRGARPYYQDGLPVAGEPEAFGGQITSAQWAR